ncbi:MAG: nucleotidyltransferase, partial [Candidatus Atribacteria bacterium]
MGEVTLVVLAAGMGSRYGGLKQIEPVGPHGELLVEYSVFDAISVGIHQVVFVIQRSQESVFREMLSGKMEGHCKVSFAYQELADLPSGMEVPLARTKPWGTGHALLSARDVVDGSFVVINADDFYGRESYGSVASFLKRPTHSGEEHALVGFSLRTTLTKHGSVSRGVCVLDERGYLAMIDERTKISHGEGSSIYWCDGNESHLLPGDAVVSMNMWAFSRSFMRDLAGQFMDFLQSSNTDVCQDEFFLPAAVSRLVSEGKARVRVLPTAAKWMGVTHRQDLAQVKRNIQSLVQHGIYPQHLW